MNRKYDYRSARKEFIECMIMRLFFRAYLHNYSEGLPGNPVGPDSRAEYRRWRPFVAAARMSEEILAQNE